MFVEIISVCVCNQGHSLNLFSYKCKHFTKLARGKKSDDVTIIMLKLSNRHWPLPALDSR